MQVVAAVSQMGEQPRSPRKVKVARRGSRVSPEQPPLQQDSSAGGREAPPAQDPFYLCPAAPPLLASPPLLPSRQSESQTASGHTALQCHKSRSQAPSLALPWSNSSRSSRIPASPIPCSGWRAVPGEASSKAEESQTPFDPAPGVLIAIPDARCN